MRGEKNNFQDERLKKKKNLCVVQTSSLKKNKNDLLKMLKLHSDSFHKVLMIHLQVVISHIFDQMRNT